VDGGNSRVVATFGVPTRLTRALVAAGALALGFAVAQAQSLEDIVEEQIGSEIEADIVEAVEQALEDELEEQIQQAIDEALEQQLESAVSEVLEQQIESGVTSALEQQLESGVADAIEQQLEAGVIGALEQQVGVAVEEAIEALLDVELVGELAEVIDQGVGELTGEGGDQAQADGRFVAELDIDGNTIEREIWVLLVPAEQIDRLQGWGFTIRSRDLLESLNAELVTVVAPADRTLAEAALELALDAPGTVVDLNHVYRVDTTSEADGPSATALSPATDEIEPGRDASGVTPAGSPRTLGVGIIDSAVDSTHEALRDALILARDFVRVDASRPVAHGTAIASLLVGRSSTLAGHVADGRLYAASVFFEDGGGEPAALTTGLVAALAWMVEQRVPVVNMSLSGPPNRALEAAVARAVERGTVVVAAVGNNGPAGRPLYPAAYETVVGVTAVDARQRVYRHAGRGPHVMFAAPGVRIRVARAGGGYGNESGTSIAAPHVAAVIARALNASAESPDAVLTRLRTTARRLGAGERDPVYGYGLIAALE
jgi:subtilisin family serine protease